MDSKLLRYYIEKELYLQNLIINMKKFINFYKKEEILLIKKIRRIREEKTFLSNI